MTTKDDSLEALKAELERFGEANDATTSERPRSMLNITRDTGEFLSVLVRATGSRRVLRSAPPTDTPPSGWLRPPGRSAAP